MMIKLRKSLFCLVMIGAALFVDDLAAIGGEPLLRDYTAYPVFTVNPVKPNILIILDNSGSMNYNAYGSPADNNELVTDQPYTGMPYPGELTYKVSTSTDDAEQNLADGYTWFNSNDIDLGRVSASDDTVVGLLFREIQLPEGTKIDEAWLEFTVRNASTTPADNPISLVIIGEASDNAVTYDSTTNNISDITSRPETTERVIWESSSVTPIDPWTTNGVVRRTPDLSRIVQEIVDREGWSIGNNLAFKLKYNTYDANAKRDAYSYDGSSSNAPVLHLKYSFEKNEDATRYYGYFNPDWFYNISSSKFKHAYKKVKYSAVGTSDEYKLPSGGTTTDGCWMVHYPADFNSPGEESHYDEALKKSVVDWNKACLRDADIISEDLWDGNWMNWASTRRIDVSRKVIMGGLATARTGGGNQVNYGEDPNQASKYYRRYFDSSKGSAVTPYSSPTEERMYGFDDGYIYVDDNHNDNPWRGYDRFTLAVDKRVEFDEEDFDDNNNVAGVMQKFWDSAYWGNEFFYYGSGKNKEGGYIASRIGTNDETLINDLQNTGADTWTPLGEAYYVAMQYFMQEKPATSLGYANSAIGSINNVNDPYYQDGEFVECAKSFVILLTDGASTKDAKIPSLLKDYDGDGDNSSCNESKQTNCDYPSGGSDYLDDVALYARTVDLRDDLDGDQNLILYTVYAFGTDPNARSLLQDAARNGGFEDRNGNNRPDGDYTDPAADRKEWDNNGDGVPDTFFEAQDGYKLEDELIGAINDILERASSGTAVSVLATSSEGEGNITQAYFRPVIKAEAGDVKWAGYLQSLWVDQKGNMREDTVNNYKLDLEDDDILRFLTDASGNTQVNKYATDVVKCYSVNDKHTDKEACEGKAGVVKKTFSVNNSTVAYSYDYYTYPGFDADSPPFDEGDDCFCEVDVYPNIEFICTPSKKAALDGISDESACDGVSADSLGSFNDGYCYCYSNPAATDEVGLDEIQPLWEAGSVLADMVDPNDAVDGRKIFTYTDGAASDMLFGGTAFTQANTDELLPYFGVKDSEAWSYLGTYVDDTDNSKDVTQSDRASNLIRYIRGFGDGFKGQTQLRSRTLSIGGTDKIWRLGDIVHSTPVTVAQPMDNYGLIYRDESYQAYFNYYKDRETVIYVGANDGMLHAFTSWKYNEDTTQYESVSAADTTSIGTELWSYIPQALLPHLKWLPREDYTHVYYVDLKPKVVDAKIFTAEAACSSSSPGPDCVHPYGWGTVLIGGLRMGGKPIDVVDDFDADPDTVDDERTFSSSYFAIDISNPRAPNLLWEKSYDGLAMTTSRPNVVKVEDKWFMVVGSGTDTYEGESSQKGKIYLVDLATGVAYGNGTDEWSFELPEDKAFMGGAVSLDYRLNFSVDSLYIGQTFDINTNVKKTPVWEGSLYRMSVPWACTGTSDSCAKKTYGTLGTFDTDGDNTTDCVCSYDEDPLSWNIGKLFDSPRPITIEPSLSTDFQKNIWVYFGTGRYLSQADKSTLDTQQLYGIKDPFFNSKHSTFGNDSDYNYPSGVDGTNNYYMDSGKTLTLEPDILFKSDLYEVIYPWGYYEAPVGDCSGVPTGQVGDIYGDGSCLASYDWPGFTCTPTTVAPTPDEMLACETTPDPVLGIVITGGGVECNCLPYEVPQWGCVEVVSGSGACNAVPEGVVDKTAEYESLYWRQTELTDGGCVDVNFGTLVSNTDCVSEEIVPPAWNANERPAGDCIVLGVEPGQTGDLSGDGSCTAGYYTCSEIDAGGCDDVDYTASTGFLGGTGDGDIFGDGTCFCQFVESPVARVVPDSVATDSLSFNETIKEARKYEGWVKSMPNPGERSVQKPAVLGGLALFSSYVPSDDTCSFGGESYLYALYFETGTAFGEDVFTPGTYYDTLNETIVVKERVQLGIGMASSPSIHVGSQAGNKAKVFLEQSTGVIKDVEVDPAFTIRSGLRYWQQK